MRASPDWNRRSSFGLPVMAACTFLGVLPVQLAAQQGALNRLVRVTVTDPANRFVTGLEQQHFEIVENGISRPITSFASVDSPISIAVVSEAPVDGVGDLRGAEDELIQTRSLTDAIRQLSASTKPRRALIVAMPAANQEIPGGIVALRTDIEAARKAVIEARNQYSIGFESSDTSAIAEVVLRQPRGLPVLRANPWK